MSAAPLDSVPLWLLFLAAVALAGLAMEGGYRLGKWRHDRVAEEKEAPVGAMVGSILGLLAFMLAFTFSMAANRFDARRQIVLEEANAIGTAYRRARLLAEPERTEVAELLREYVNARLPDTQHGNVTQAVGQAIARSEELNAKLWSRAIDAAQKNPTVMTGQFLQSLNEVIELHARRVQVATRSRVPNAIWAGLSTLALLAMTSVGYQAGLSATRRSPAMIGMVLAFAGVLLLIADLDRGFEGFLSVSQQAMLDLQKSMTVPNP